MCISNVKNVGGTVLGRYGLPKMLYQKFRSKDDVYLIQGTCNSVVTCKQGSGVVR